MIKFFINSVPYLQKKLPLKNAIVPNICYLHPSWRNKSEGSGKTAFLAKQMPQLSTDVNFLDLITSEWRLCQTDAEITAD